ITTGTNNMTLTSFVGDNTSAGGSNAYQKNGYAVYLVSGGNLGLNGTVTSTPLSGGSARNINITAQNQILINGATTVGSASSTVANNITVASAVGIANPYSVSTGTSGIWTNGNNLSLYSGGSINIYGPTNTSPTNATFNSASGGAVTMSAGTSV